MWFRTALKTITLIAAVCGTASCARDQNTSGGTGRSLDHVIVEIEAGRATTPFVAQPVPGSEATVTFLVKSDDGEVPRIVSDVTGWGEAPDDSSFDLGIGTMTRINATPWYRLDTVVAPEARIEYLVVHGETDYQVDAVTVGDSARSLRIDGGQYDIDVAHLGQGRYEVSRAGWVENLATGERTAALEQSNARLQAQIEETRKAQRELEPGLDLGAVGEPQEGVRGDGERRARRYRSRAGWYARHSSASASRFCCSVSSSLRRAWSTATRTC